MADTPKPRAHREFTDEFKASAVRLVIDEGKTVGEAARDLDLTETALREWVSTRQRKPPTPMWPVIATLKGLRQEES